MYFGEAPVNVGVRSNDAPIAIIGTVQVDQDGAVFPLEAKVLGSDQSAQVTASQTWNARLRSSR